ncbi:MAG: Fic family protein [Parcubacteria group bacterium]|nr:Fic family protein [Parcubacteria group bacterium]
MFEISQKQQKILELFLRNNLLSSSEVYDHLSKEGEETSLVTIKRELSHMATLGLLIASGQGRSRAYSVSVLGRIFSKVDANSYNVVEPDKRYGLANFNFELLPSFPSEIFASAELAALEQSTDEYRKRTANLPMAIQKKELERLIIELSWKSSKIEGNTYTLLDTEKLILEHKEAPGHDKKEAKMILNHKEAFEFVHNNKKEFTSLTRTNLEQLHGLLIKNMGVSAGLRQKPVGIIGSKYRPLDNIHQIREAVESLAAAITRARTPYDKALLCLVGISYIQPFEDGNKRTARIMANALLLAHDCAPLSYRSVEEKDYREATLVFYELNSIVPFKSIFIEQYVFAAKNYAVK